MLLKKLITKGLVALPSEQSLEFSDKRKIAIVGENGAGKTSLLDCIPIALFGKAPNRPKSMYDCFRGNDALVDLEWESNGQTYRARRLINANARTQKPYFYVNGTPITEGKADEFNAAILQYLGMSEQTFFASAYCSQNGFGNALSLNDQGRRDLLTEILGLDQFDKPYLLATDHYSQLDKSIGSLEAQKLTLSDLSQDIHALDMDRNSLLFSIQIVKDQISVKETEIQQIRQRIANAKANAQGVEELSRQATLLRSEIDKDNTLITDLQTRIKNNQDHVLGKKDAILKAVAQTKLLVDLNATQHVKHLNLMNECDRLDIEHRKVSDQLLAEKRVLTVEHDAVTDSNNMKQKKQNDLQKQIGSLIAQEALLKRQSESLKLVPCNGIRNNDALLTEACPLLTDANMAERTLIDNSGKIAQLKADLDTIVMESTDLIRLQISEKDNLITQHNGSFSSADMRLEAKVILQDIATNTAQMKDYAPLLQNYARLETVEETIQDYQGQIDGATLRMNSNQLAYDHLALKIHDATEIVQTLNREELNLVGALAEVDPLHLLLTDGHNRIGQIDAMIKTAEETQEKLSTIDFELEKAKDAISLAAILREGLGPKGAKALKIDSTGPEISELVNSLLYECYGPRFSISIQTLKTLGSGDTRESLEFSIVDNETGEQANVETKSGGEQQLIKEVISLAFCIYQKLKSGIDIKTLVRDEACSALSEENSIKYIQMLDRALDIGGFAQVLYVSHKNVAQNLADATIEIANGKVTVL